MSSCLTSLPLITIITSQRWRAPPEHYGIDDVAAKRKQLFGSQEELTRGPVIQAWPKGLKVCFLCTKLDHQVVDFKSRLELETEV
jgi:hypothetical protein